MHLIKKTIFILLVFAVLIAGLIVAAPLYVPSLSSYFLKSQGIVVESVQMRPPSIDSWVITKAQFRTQKNLRFNVETAILRFSWPELLRGHLKAVDIENIVVTRRLVTDVAQDSETEGNEQAFSIESFHQNLKNFPVDRIFIRKGNIDHRMTVQGFDFSSDQGVLNLDGQLILQQQNIELTGSLNKDDQFSIQANAGDSHIESEGQVSNNSIKGTGYANINVALLQSWLPEPAKFLSGMVNATTEFSITEENSRIRSDSQIALKGNLAHPNYFESLQLNQTVSLSGPLASPNLIINAGEALKIKNLIDPVALSEINIGLSAPLELREINRGFKVEQRAALRVRSNRDELDVVFNDNQVSINGELPSVKPGFYLSSALEVASLSPLSVTVLKDSQITLGRISDYGNVVVKASSDFSIEEKAREIYVQQTLPLLLSSEAMQIAANIQGKIFPMDLSIDLNSKKVVVSSNEMGNGSLKAKINQTNNKINANFNVKIAGLDVVASAEVNEETKQGKMELFAKNLTQLSSFLANQCIEITSGSVVATGEFNLNNGFRSSGTFSMADTGLLLQDKPVKNINTSGAWRYSDDSEKLELNAALTLPEIDIGILVKEFKADLRYQGDAILIDKLDGQTLGGRLYGVNQRWYLGQTRNELQLYADQLDLHQLVALEDYDGLQVSGRINATLPIIIDSGAIQVVGGKVEAVKPGGEIHLPVDSSSSTGAQKEAFEALQNFHFETLSGGISGPIALDPNGLLVSNLTLRGSNPDMGRPVSLNLSIEQNTYPIFQTLELFDKLNRIGQCSN